jgi:cytochrome bd-type quinol oxidase subunit 2
VDDEHTGLVEKDGETEMHARVFIDIKRIAFVLLVLVLLVGTMLVDPGVAVAQNTEITEASGRDLGIRDWLDHLPLALGSALLVVVVDALFIVKIIRDRRKPQGPV